MYKVVKEGKGGITAKIVVDSINTNGNRITTFELEYHRYIHGELMTHRLFSRNAMSSRAVPVHKMIDQSDTVPIHFGKNQSGMQADLEHSDIETGKALWDRAKNNAVQVATEMSDLGFHKQVVNRILEPFQMMKVIVTATEFENFFWLRCDKDAQPEIQELAYLMYECRKESLPEVLYAGEYHTPYVGNRRDPYGNLEYIVEGKSVSEEEAVAISSSCCAQVSYRNIDNTYEKAMKVYERLGVGGNKIHASPFEHVARVMKDFKVNTSEWEDGITHQDKEGNLWSGNFKGFVQHRQELENHTKW